MKSALIITLLARAAVADESNPLGKVFELMTSLEAKIVKEGEAEAKAFKEFFSWCDEASQNVNFQIKTAATKKEKLEAQIGELTSAVDVSESKIEDLAAAISQADGELAAADGIRSKEAAEFAASEKELVETVDTLDRAISIVSTEMSKNPAALAQIDTTSMHSLVQSLTAVVDAAGFSTTDSKRLAALVQQKSSQGEESDELGAPAAASYKSQSGGIVDVLEDLKEKGEGELSEARKAESAAKHNYAMMKQSLDDQMAADNKDLSNEKSGKASAEEGKATAEGDLAVTIKDLANSQQSLATANGDCMTTAADHEATVAARKAELDVIAQAEKILKDSTSGAVGQTYSFTQVVSQSTSALRTRADLANSEIITLVKKLAREQHSSALAQLASRLSAVIKYGGRDGSNPFAKVKGLISDMIGKLEKEAEGEATEKAYCDEQIAKTEAKKADLEATISKLTNKVDRAASKSAELKEEAKQLQADLASLAKQQAEMDNVRRESNAAYTTAKADLTQGLTGVRGALGLLKEYYGGAAAMIQSGDSNFMQQPAAPEQHAKASGAGGSIINILEVCESDFATNLAKEETEEGDAAGEYEKVTQENKISKTMKTQDVKYKTQEAIGLDKTISELSSDRETTNSELSAVLEYYGQIKGRCIAKPETYEDRKARREAEISGLKEALEILNTEAAFLQKKKHHFRGSAVGTL